MPAPQLSQTRSSSPKHLCFVLISAPVSNSHSPSQSAVTCAIIVAVASVLATACAPSPEPQDRETSQRQQVKRLRSLPYAHWAPLPETEGGPVTGVTRHEPGRTSPGLNLYCPRSKPKAFLVNNSGTVVHQWMVVDSPSWQHVELISGDDLLVVVKERYLGRLDWSSKPLWVRDIRAHHEATEGPDGRIYAATRQEELVTLHGIEIPVLADYITILSADGEVLENIPLLEVLEHTIGPERAQAAREWATTNDIYTKLDSRSSPGEIVIEPDTPADLFHLNSIEVIDRDIPGVCRKGDLLISPRQINMIAIIEPDSRKVAWSWGAGELEYQHHPTMLANGNILVFDNGPRRGYSRVLELDPLEGCIIWEYRGSAEEPFFSSGRGSSQRLANGNTLITESDTGRSFEVTPEGEIVWEYLCPILRTKPEGTFRATVYRMIRITSLERRG